MMKEENAMMQCNEELLEQYFVHVFIFLLRSSPWPSSFPPPATRSAGSSRSQSVTRNPLGTRQEKKLKLFALVLDRQEKVRKKISKLNPTPHMVGTKWL
jgi:hypothetical protein